MRLWATGIQMKGFNRSNLSTQTHTQKQRERDEWHLRTDLLVGLLPVVALRIVAVVHWAPIFSGRELDIGLFSSSSCSLCLISFNHLTFCFSIFISFSLSALTLSYLHRPQLSAHQPWWRSVKAGHWTEHKMHKCKQKQHQNTIGVLWAEWTSISVTISRQLMQETRQELKEDLRWNNYIKSHLSWNETI